MKAIRHCNMKPLQRTIFVSLVTWIKQSIDRQRQSLDNLSIKTQNNYLFSYKLMVKFNYLVHRFHRAWWYGSLGGIKYPQYFVNIMWLMGSTSVQSNWLPIYGEPKHMLLHVHPSCWWQVSMHFKFKNILTSNHF